MNARELAEGLEPVVEQLSRIADLLEFLAQPPPPADADAACPHPLEQRVDFSAPGVDEFHCKACGAHIARQAKGE